MKLTYMEPGDRGWWRFKTKEGFEYRLVQCNHRTDRRTRDAATSILYLSNQLEPSGGGSFDLDCPVLDGESDVVSLDHVKPFLEVGAVIRTYSYSPPERFITGGSSQILAKIESLEYRDEIPRAKLSLVEGELMKGDPMEGYLTDFAMFIPQ